MVCCEQVDMAQHLWVNAAHNRGPRCAVLQELKPLGGDTQAGRTALKRRRLQGPPAIKQEELAHEPGSPAHAACPSSGRGATPLLPVVALKMFLLKFMPNTYYILCLVFLRFVKFRVLLDLPVFLYW